MKIYNKKIYFKLLILLLVSLTFIGCANGKKFLKPEKIINNKSIIYFYKPISLSDKISHKITIENNLSETKTLGIVENNGYLKYVALEGNYKVKVEVETEDIFLNFFNSFKSISFEIKVEKNKVYCYKFGEKNTALFEMSPDEKAVEVSECMEDLLETRESNYVKIEDK